LGAVGFEVSAGKSRARGGGRSSAGARRQRSTTQPPPPDLGPATTTSPPQLPSPLSRAPANSVVLAPIVVVGEGRRVLAGWRVHPRGTSVFEPVELARRSRRASPRFLAATRLPLISLLAVDREHLAKSHATRAEM